MVITEYSLSSAFNTTFILCSNGYRFFQATDFGKVLVELRDPELRSVFANDTMVQQFQGSAFFVLTLWDLQKSKDKIFDLCLDGNGGWRSKQDKHKSVAGKDNSVEWYYFRYFVHNGSAIKKVVGYLVHSQESTTLSADFVLIRYYWRGSDGQPKFPEEFLVKAERRGKTVLKALKDAAQQPVRGRALTPTVIFHKVMDSVSPEDRLVNPYMTPKDRRQATTAKQAAKKDLFGNDDLSFLMNQPNVEFKNLVTNNGTELIFFLCHNYQKNLFRAAGMPQYHIKVNLDSS